MSIKIARMANGEDVVADIKEVRDKEGDDARVLAYEFQDAFSIQLEMNEKDFLVEEKDNPLGDIRMRFYPYFPLTVGANFISLQHVVSIADPHWEVVKRYEEALTTIKKSKPQKDDVKVDYSEVPPNGILVG
tara:strand:- start:1305 stop:1700 length:396 start_codon:yes stop_codon:yes gene_type:complete